MRGRGGRESLNFSFKLFFSQSHFVLVCHQASFTSSFVAMQREKSHLPSSSQDVLISPPPSPVEEDDEQLLLFKPPSRELFFSWIQTIFTPCPETIHTRPEALRKMAHNVTLAREYMKTPMEQEQVISDLLKLPFVRIPNYKPGYLIDHNDQEALDAWLECVLSICTAVTLAATHLTPFLYTMIGQFEYENVNVNVNSEYESKENNAAHEASSSSLISCKTIKEVLRVLPMARPVLCQALVFHYPHAVRPLEHHQCYLKSLERLVFECCLRIDKDSVNRWSWLREFCIGFLLKQVMQQDDFDKTSLILDTLQRIILGEPCSLVIIQGMLEQVPILLGSLSMNESLLKVIIEKLYSPLIKQFPSMLQRLLAALFLYLRKSRIETQTLMTTFTIKEFMREENIDNDLRLKVEHLLMLHERSIKKL